MPALRGVERVGGKFGTWRECIPKGREVDLRMPQVDRKQVESGRGAARLMHALVDASVDRYFPILDQIDEFVSDLEERVFINGDTSALHEIFHEDLGYAEEIRLDAFRRRPALANTMYLALLLTAPVLAEKPEWAGGKALEGGSWVVHHAPDVGGREGLGLGLSLVKHIIENEMLNGEVIRLDGAIRMAPK